MRCNILFPLLLVLFFFSCSATDDYADMVLSNLRKADIKIENYSHVVIIPDVGCGGCISEAEHFFKENIKGSFFFIFTKVYSLKELRLRHGDILESKNVLIDVEQEYASLSDEINIYPIIIDVRNTQKPVWKYLEPGISYQDVFKKLK